MEVDYNYERHLLDDRDSYSLCSSDSIDDEFWDSDNDDDLFLYVGSTRSRNEKYQHTRLWWEDHLEKLQHEGMFARTDRMTYQAFLKLLLFICPKLQCQTGNSNQAGSELIKPELVMAIALHWLSGGSYIDIRHAYFCSVASIYRCRNTFIDAICSCEALDIIFPETPKQIKAAVDAFSSRSSNKVLRGCIGALDGFLAKINCPSMEDCKNNADAYFSGHYQTHGINVQAVCDHKSRFIFFAVAAPGKTADQVAFKRTSLPAVLAKLPSGMYVAVDAAYMLTETCMFPFTGSQRKDKDKDAFNFYLSQLRIQIEMAFGLMTNKWLILRRNLTTSLAVSALLLTACARLHNYVVDEDGIEYDDRSILRQIQPINNAPFGWGSSLLFKSS